MAIVVVIYFCTNFQWHFEVRKPPASQHHISSTLFWLLWKKRASVYRTDHASWNKFKQKHVRGDPLLSFQACRQEALPSVVRNEICLLHERAPLHCCRWARGLPHTPYLRASQDSTWQSQLRPSSRSFPSICFFKCALVFFLSLTLSHQNHWA